VADQDIEIFYVTNRKVHLMEPTLLNLQRMGFPYADEAHLLMRENDNSKESRRRLVNGKYKVILLLGDNLDDFTNAFEKRDIEGRKEMASVLRTSFGRRFIVFPNPMYGSWESLLYNEADSLGFKTKGETRYHFLNPFPLSQ
jgi:5'-nucleotidase (lipoprotein e(P4) family)